MGQVSSRLFGTANDEFVDSKNNPIVHNKEKVNSYKSKSKEVNTGKFKIPFFSCVKPRLPLKRSRHISPEPEVPQNIKDIFSPEKRARMDDYLDFIFLNDYNSISYIKKSKIIFIVRGLPGSGKSTVAKTIKKSYADSEICSADNFFMVNGIYEYDVSKIGDAHDQCHQNAIKAVQNQCSAVIIDNTHVRLWEMKFYLELAKEFNYIPIIIEPKTPWRRELQTLVQNNTHNVTEDTLALKIKSFQEINPFYCGWFLNEKDSSFLILESQSWLRKACEFSDFKKDLRSYTGCQSFEELLKYFQKPKSELLYHCTSKYYKSEDRKIFVDGSSIIETRFIDALGSTFVTEVIGFILTPRTFGARLKLSPKQKELWAQNDEEEVPAEFSEIVPTIYDSEDCCLMEIQNLENGSSLSIEDISNMSLNDIISSENIDAHQETPKKSNPESSVNDDSVCSENAVLEISTPETHKLEPNLMEASNSSLDDQNKESSEINMGQETISDAKEPEAAIVALSPKSSKQKQKNKVKSPQNKEGKSHQKKQTEIPKYEFNCDDSKVSSTFECHANLTENRFHPNLGVGRRAHITLGCGPDIAPVTTGVDQIFVTQLEQLAIANNDSPSHNNSSTPVLNEEMSQKSSKEPKISVQTINIDGAVLKSYGYGVWVVYPENRLKASSVFAINYSPY